jgi:hypothetical protein
MSKHSFCARFFLLSETPYVNDMLCYGTHTNHRIVFWESHTKGFALCNTAWQSVLQGEEVVLNMPQTFPRKFQCDSVLHAPHILLCESFYVVHWQY